MRHALENLLRQQVGEQAVNPYLLQLSVTGEQAGLRHALENLLSWKTCSSRFIVSVNRLESYTGHSLWTLHRPYRPCLLFFRMHRLYVLPYSVCVPSLTHPRSQCICFIECWHAPSLLYSALPLRPFAVTENISAKSHNSERNSRAGPLEYTPEVCLVWTRARYLRLLP